MHSPGLMGSGFPLVLHKAGFDSAAKQDCFSPSDKGEYRRDLSFYFISLVREVQTISSVQVSVPQRISHVCSRHFYMFTKEHCTGFFQQVLKLRTMLLVLKPAYLILMVKSVHRY